ncbi:hypothetical protein HMPREF3203_00237 [Proteus mirabilis]|nr:hypothetical protein HMPREF3203_00237 [Proteus mirabilis]
MPLIDDMSYFKSIISATLMKKRDHHRNVSPAKQKRTKRSSRKLNRFLL